MRVGSEPSDERYDAQTEPETKAPGLFFGDHRVGFFWVFSAHPSAS
jgi:hypothetical protein